MDFSVSSDSLNFNSVVTYVVAMPPGIEHLPGLSARAAFTVNSQSVFKEDVDFFRIDGFLLVKHLQDIMHLILPISQQTVTVWFRKCLSTKPFSAISPILFGYSRDYD